MLDRLLTDSVEVQRQSPVTSGRTPLPGWTAVGTFTGALLDVTGASGARSGEETQVGAQEGTANQAVAIFAAPPAPDVRAQDRVRVGSGPWFTVQALKGGRRSPLRVFCERVNA